VNGVGKPCAGEPHARFERGGLLGTAGEYIGDTKKDQSDDPSLGHRQSPMYSIAQPAAYLTVMKRPVAGDALDGATFEPGENVYRGILAI
jgi:hypothetical protein